jgi:cytochrome bd ubiquinol oxidase subunit II
MATVWFVLVALMLVGYVLLDGFDLGAGALHLFAARNDEERRLVLRSVGPVWDGNEVWLLAAGGTLFYAFPLLYASSFSGFYLPLMIVLWLLLLRGIGIEFRSHLETPVWRDFFDGVFCLSSGLLAVFFGAALGNVIRGVPLGEELYFFVPLWTDFRPAGSRPGVLDWYTVLSAVVALAALMLHGALYVAMKTEGPVNSRMRRAVSVLLPAVTLLTLMSLAASLRVRPAILRNFAVWPAGWVIPAVVAFSLAGIYYFDRFRQERNAFLCSCAYLAAMLAGAAFALYPTLLPATTGEANDLTIFNAAAGQRSLTIGLGWWSAGMVVAIGYFVFVYRMFRGKVSASPGASHY